MTIRSTKSQPPAAPPSVYEHDYVAWIDAQARTARDGKVADLDLPNLAEELEDMGRRERRELASRAETLLMHLLTYEFQPEQRSGSWRGTIVEQRSRIAALLKDSPSLLGEYQELCRDPVLLRNAATRAAAETGLPAASFPEPGKLSSIAARMLDPDFWPGPGPHPDLAPRKTRRSRST